MLRTMFNVSGFVQYIINEDTVFIFPLSLHSNILPCFTIFYRRLIIFHLLISLNLILQNIGATVFSIYCPKAFGYEIYKYIIYFVETRKGIRLTQLFMNDWRLLYIYRERILNEEKDIFSLLYVYPISLLTSTSSSWKSVFTLLQLLML